ncbi:MAG: DMT family transporter [Rhodocyclales bacterium]|nr:DMT family transporter [Rhodocyclales bacterium]
MQAEGQAGAGRWRGYLAAGVVVLCWSGFNIVSRLGATGSLAPADLAALRFGVSGLIALPFFVMWAPVAHWPRYLALALLGGLGYGLPVYAGFARAPAAHAGVFVNGGIPFWSILLLGAASGFRFPRRVLIALAISTLGLILIAAEGWAAHDGPRVMEGDALFLLAALDWALFGLLMRHWAIRPLSAIAGVASFSMLLYLPVYALWLTGPGLLRASPPELLLQGIYQGIIAALVAASCYSYANRVIGVIQASMTLSLVPGVSALGGLWLLHEPLGPLKLLGIGAVTVGAVMCVGRG